MEIQDYVTAIRRQIRSVLVGQEQTAALLLTSLLAEGHVLLEDVPGTGKTLLARTMAAVLDLSFARIQFTPDLLPSDVTGLHYYDQKTGEFPLRKGPVFTQILLADEINRTTPRTQSSLLEAMEERQVTIDGETHKLAEPFFVIATQNPIETAGTYPLPEAQLDRFLMQLSMGYPDKAGEQLLLDRVGSGDPLAEVRPVCGAGEVQALREAAWQVYVHPALQSYLIDLVQATRRDTQLTCGVSPRGTLALFRAVRAYALVQGRDYVVPEDIKLLAEPVLAHRVSMPRMMGTVSGTEGKRAAIRRLLQTVALPTEDWSRGV